MSTHKAPKLLSTSERAAALAAVRRKKATSSNDSASFKAAEPRKRKAPSFSSLPGFQEMRIQRAAADLLGVDNPFFRAHDARAAATTLIDGQEYLNFASYDYVGLNGHPEVVAAAKQAADHYGLSASASRVVAGERPIHSELEAKLARLHGVEDAVAFVSGHATNVSAIGQLMQPNDLILHDAYIHNSIVTGAKLAGAVRQAFPHNDLEALENLLASRAHNHERVLIVVEGVYSMDGDYPNLKRLIDIKERYGAWLMVDEAHSIGILGEKGRGLAEHFREDPKKVDIWMGTFSKTLASCGGYIAGSKDMVEYLKFTASGFVFSVGLSPVLAAGVSKAIDVMEREPERVVMAQANGAYFLAEAKAAGLDTGVSQGCAVVPIMIGDSLKATVIAAKLLEEGVNVLPIIYPAVPEKASRLRFFITSEHSKDQLDTAIRALRKTLDDYDANPISIEHLATMMAG
ncbi:aminotransferase class I/II-fold pyridoxal phosphate-dependent enzyme [Pseudovibrio sp. SPO723]|uniref:aminotransferase class I/II-fold pyridoxal phosphate-dependent enzyme n=1 Tax=Nesiotobacter zosterae TaxID=392721 RepID=UPI0029C46490|nr:aminotransferase class I/II-fold pyridoxal phosphate-dependent enzyme [Pseudovibrio sp. SPO723]MDX5594362.1 aminotransferase class I/II-fold pyridoxal phosphate-dependent enzyme [Pseudovibrio sp. SPO723]